MGYLSETRIKHGRNDTTEKSVTIPLVYQQRCKVHNTLLASVTVIKKNKTYKMWFQEINIEFKLAS